jgi:sterol desaturase/sphingolipid hydroxylase (fatty acid hydroxylase superfamily)
MPDFPSVTQLAIPFFIAAILGEIVWIRFFGGAGEYETHDTAASLLMGVGNVAMGLVFGFISYGILMWFWQFRFFDLGIGWLVGIAAFLIDDLRYYWYHRIAHTCRWFWAEHVNHHSSQHYNLSTALRQSWTGNFTGAVLLQVPMVLLGFHPAFVAFVYGFNLVYQFWIHTETIRRLPWWFEAVMNTPSHHRVHHATNARYLDANFAGTLIIWDKLFGTFVPETEADRPRYGLVSNIATFNPIKVAFHEWIAMLRDAARPGLSPGHRLRYLFKPPGWSHDGSRRTSGEIKRDYVRRNPGEAGMPGLPPAAH